MYKQRVLCTSRGCYVQAEGILYKQRVLCTNTVIQILRQVTQMFLKYTTPRHDMTYLSEPTGR